MKYFGIIYVKFLMNDFEKYIIERNRETEKI